jgi:putative PIN family toxin of toxin-antitoxin system
MRLVLDTDVIVASFRSPRGASAELVRRIRQGRAAMLVTVPLFFEYEAVLGRPDHLAAAGADADAAKRFLDVLAALLTPVETHFRWRPRLRDPDDDMVLEAAVNGRADAIVTFNRRDFAPVAGRFGIDLLLPVQALRSS